MIRWITGKVVLLCAYLCLFPLAAAAQDVPTDYQEVLKVLDRKGDFKTGVLKVNIPRTYLKMTVEGFPAPTPFGFGGWIVLTKATNGSEVMMGDLVLLQEEVNPVLSTLFEGGLEVTALHNHFFWDDSASLVKAQASEPLKLEKKIELPEVQGRIDHMSVDVKTQRLFISALGNNTVEVVDLKAGKRSNTISGLQEPQGVLYVPTNDRLYVASGKDGTVKIFDGTSLQLLKTIEYGDDADNLRYDASRQRIYVGYGVGALGELNAEGQKVKEIKLDAHPESFQLEKDGSRIYVNLPKSRKVAVVDRENYSVITTWGTGLSLANYPMALDESDHRLFVVTRFPARLLVIDTDSGKTIQKLSAVGDCDDVFFDQARKRIYASGGEGAISVFDQKDPDHYAEVGRIPTVNGARTSFYSPEFGRLYLAVRRQGTAPAMIQVFEVRE